MKVDTEHGPNLYSVTGRIADINTMLVNRNDLRQLLPWWQRLSLCWRNWQRSRKFRIHME